MFFQPFYFYLTLQPVIARYEAIPNRQRGYANPPCTVRDCSVPTHEVVVEDVHVYL